MAGGAKRRPDGVSSWFGGTTLLCCCLFAATGLVFAQTLKFGFVNYDDDVYVYHNPEVRRGVTLDGINWAFRHVYAANWHPLTWVSHMLDCSVWGMSAGGHHATNVVLHAISGVLLLLVLRRMTGDLWPSAFAAAVFALHPLRVESVAWIAERKDVLSGVFFILTLLAYLHYCGRPGTVRYLLLCVTFILGLLAKPSLVPVPFLLLLLDYWPLRRATTGARRLPTGQTPWRRLILEKAPLLAISAGSAAATLFAQKFSVTVASGLPVPDRLANALLSCAVYLRQTVYPVRLAVFYPHPGTFVALLPVILAAIVLAGITSGVVLLRRRYPYLVTGWGWYLLMLLPTLGLVQVGFQAHADRYTYLAQIGICLMIAWGLQDALPEFVGAKVRLAGAIAIIACLAVTSGKQCSHWRDSEALWTHTLQVTSANPIAHNNLGNVYLDRGEFSRARQQYEASLEITRSLAGQSTPLGLMERAYVDAENNLGVTLTKTGHETEGVQCFERVLSQFPNNPKAHLNMGNVLLDGNRVDDAIVHYRTALNLLPDYADAHCNLGNALAQSGQVDAAISEYEKAIQLQPDLIDARNNLGVALVQKGLVGNALTEWSRSLEFSPDSIDALNNLAWILATYPDESLRNGSKALQLADRAARLSVGRNPAILRTLAAAEAEAGRFEDAEQVVRQAIDSAGSNPDFVEVLEQDLARFRLHEPLRTAANLDGKAR